MSKPTASAAGGAMPAEGHKTRRAALRLFAGAPALAILPAGSALALASTASPVHPDAALFAMRPAIDAADRELEAALDALNPAEEAYLRQRAGQAETAGDDFFGRRAAGDRCLAPPPDEGRQGALARVGGL